MELRNIAIIAHVDHGKTTLVDALLTQSENFKIKAGAPRELIMDSNELERERGITIFSKNASIKYHNVKINIVDTPGHADFGGEVERIMRMVDGVLLLVDAKEGPMPQTKFVLRKAIEAGHKIIVVINKVDKFNARPKWVLNATLDLFFELGASEAQINFPVIYAAAIQGKAGLNSDLNAMKNIQPIFEAIVKYIPAPLVQDSKPLQMLTVNLAYDNYKGKIAIGRLYSGILRKGMAVSHINRLGKIKRANLSAVMLFDGLNRLDVDEAFSGDIVAVAGIPDISIGETIADLEEPVALPTIQIDEPTIKMTFGVNTSPFKGKEGQYTTSRNIKERLEHELETDVALTVTPTKFADRWVVAGRGELHLAILIEKMRREGFEFEVSKPQVIFKEKDGKKMEPMELVSIEVPGKYSGVVIEMMGKRSGVMKDMRTDAGNVYMDFLIPARGLIGSRGEFLTNTRGMGIMNSIFFGYEEYKGDIQSETRGSIISTETGVSNNFGLVKAQGRGKLFISAGTAVYEGMVVGQNAKAGDVLVNICKTRELTNFRAKNEGLQEQLEVPLTLSLEDSLSYISDDEMVEITPKSIRIRKIFLTENERKKAKRSKNE
ncbi:translational GTPase TypA [Candidatus Jorgensenbacteria bacterium CG_4_10_14_0_8_um_filter_39_13]|uniref:50S ribosomal subunit assembly factor BipA n=2 Tax=Candidatus Joergenseniibacteriota TaxID=1752739 RepID=A0A2M7RFG0_9BACT|nr:MAG: translational GTPase TypA [Candidatus Jorgensenbacteria bacterium CG11_big_fil_rev_8_21_14_0_20_38_23]PIV12961.1 MAG: translational GTPase TypA [Candidatus Jorgensenbacteria bacterium CG03_land_8_20_14_0_80_38_39]PIW97683.1 MAG: translational GTPase TypA [Candidatus Jorgensenbacteria bacterium CG_4_8_14_3_um_filter_38_10]PIY95480.1 MAG: translational GTPase TypA [Candidatus Jorgensenbacteria bacterium CG_4_10_14_0_8_um_filter_39_13]PJA94806.1 MAG: translational GTPase TypA [Candidatus J